MFIGFVNGVCCSKLENLRYVVLTDLCVYGTGPHCDLQRATPNIEELCLSKNLISSWEEVAKICRQLEYLECLDLRCSIYSFSMLVKL